MVDRKMPKLAFLVIFGLIATMAIATSPVPPAFRRGGLIKYADRQIRQMFNEDSEEAEISSTQDRQLFEFKYKSGLKVLARVDPDTNSCVV